MTDGGELHARLQALLGEAREAGGLAALADLLEESAAEAAAEARAGAAASKPATNGKPPSRFGMIGSSAPMEAVFDLIERVAPSDVPVLVIGETGTGKELVARALHDHSKRAKKPFLAENCAAVSATLLESELFGHTKGSFTGAIADRPGHFVAADGGTVFLDEIGDMPLEMQSKLLRVLENAEVRPVGSNKTLKIDVRIVAATNKDLAAMAKSGEFREDLFYRLNVITLKLPPLRERGDDVAELVRFFVDRIAAEMALEPALPEERISPAALECLAAWRWPGNVRELENEIRRCLAMSTGRIEVENLSPHLCGEE